MTIITSRCNSEKMTRCESAAASILPSLEVSEPCQLRLSLDLRRSHLGGSDSANASPKCAYSRSPTGNSSLIQVARLMK